MKVMPNFNQTGPEGQGPMTGRRMGRCTNFGAPLTKRSGKSDAIENEEQADSITVRGRGWFPGRGFGCRGAGRGSGMGYGMGRQNRYRGGC